MDLVKRIFQAVGPESAAAPFLAAGLDLAGEKAEVVDEGSKEQLLDRFLSDEVLSKPIGFFYAWGKLPFAQRWWSATFEGLTARTGQR